MFEITAESVALSRTDDHIEFFFDSARDMNHDIPAFNPFELNMSARDRRDVCESQGTDGPDGRWIRASLSWGTLAECAATLAQLATLEA